MVGKACCDEIDVGPFADTLVATVKKKDAGNVGVAEMVAWACRFGGRRGRSPRESLFCMGKEPCGLSGVRLENSISCKNEICDVNDLKDVVAERKIFLCPNLFTTYHTYTAIQPPTYPSTPVRIVVKENHNK